MVKKIETEEKLRLQKAQKKIELKSAESNLARKKTTIKKKPLTTKKKSDSIKLRY